MIPRGDLEKALALYRSNAIDIEALCGLMAEYGAQRQRGGATLDGVLRTLGIQTADGTSVDQETVNLRKASPPKPPPLPVEAQHTIVDIPDDAQLSGIARLVSAPDGARTPLQSFCEERGLMPTVTLPLEAGAPPLDAPGNARYAMGSRLGVGGVGQVHWAVDRDLRRSVALKHLHNTSNDLQIQAFLEEAIIAGGLEHPNIVPIYEISHDPALGGPYYVMKHLDGDPLHGLLSKLRIGDQKTHEQHGLFRLLDSFIDVCRAIAYAHDHGVVHCDLKPANIIIGRYGEVTVVDWGLAKVMGMRGSEQARAQMWSGTPAYMSPEQINGTIDDIGMSTDIWALGTILYELLTLSVPFIGETSDEILVKVMADAVEPPSERAPERHVPGEIERICLRALHKDRGRRYASAHDLLHDLQSYLEGERERRQRAEEIDEAVKKARRIFTRLTRSEEQVDVLQAHALTLPDGLPYDQGVELKEARDDLVFGYGDACGAICQGLKLDAQHPALQHLAGDLYWRSFGRLYPGRISPDASVRTRGVEILSKLSEHALAAIVHAGRQIGIAARDDVHDDPWLSVVLGFCEDRPDALSSAPGAIAQTIERVAFLKAVPIFEHMAGHELLPIADACEQVDFASGELIFSQGDPGRELYVVIRGAVQITHDGAVLTTLGPKSCFGEIAVLDESSRTASAVCRTNVCCLRLTARRFRGIIARHGDIGLSVMRVLTRRLRLATDREAKLRRKITR